MNKYLFFSILFFTGCSYEQPEYNPVHNEIYEEDKGNEDDNNNEEEDDIDLFEWNLVWSEEFDDYKLEDQVENRKLLKNKWNIQNSPSNHILCGRYEENVEISNGTLKLINKKEKRNGQDWTSGNIWTKEKFQYGYYECRYRYAAATATNNSFWLMSEGTIEPEKGYRFEIDINEGHYPNEVNTNIHKWSGTHTSNSKSFVFGIQPGYSFQLEIPVFAKKIRFSSNNQSHFHLKEFRIFNVASSYPDPLIANWTDNNGIINYASSAKVTASGIYESKYPASNAVDNNISTGWVTQTDGEKWIEFELTEARTIGCLQFVNGYQSGDKWTGMIKDYKIQYEKDGKWVDIVNKDASNDIDFSNNYHTYGLEWTEDEIIFYFDRKEIRREKNEFCKSKVPIWLSLAIIAWAGQVTDAIDGTQMEVDYVRVYERK